MHPQTPRADGERWMLLCSSQLRCSPSPMSHAVPPASPLRLADIEWQLCLQYCTARDILAVARCCRHLHSVSDTPFAWRHAPTLMVSCGPDRPLVPAECNGLMRRHGALALRWITKSDLPLSETDLALVEHLASQVANFDAGRRWPEATATCLRICSAFARHGRLQQLAIGFSMQIWSDAADESGGWMKTLATLPTFRSLTWLFANGYKPAIGLSLVPQLPALTTLKLGMVDNVDVARAISQCAHLQRLELTFPFSRVLFQTHEPWQLMLLHPQSKLPATLQLLTLSLDSDNPMVTLKEGLSGMLQLHSLRLYKMARFLSVLLPACHFAPALRLLLVEWPFTPCSEEDVLHQQAVPLMQALLQAKPALQLQLLPQAARAAQRQIALNHGREMAASCHSDRACAITHLSAEFRL